MQDRQDLFDYRHPDYETVKPTLSSLISGLSIFIMLVGALSIDLVARLGNP